MPTRCQERLAASQLENATLKEQLAAAQVMLQDDASTIKQLQDDLAECRADDPPAPPVIGFAKGDSTGGQFVYDFSQADQQKELDLMKEAGVSWIRIDFALGNTAKPRDLALRAHAQGLKVLGTLVWTRYTAPSAVIVAATAAAEAPYVDALEVGNECNLWSQYSASPEEYAKIFNAGESSPSRTSAPFPSSPRV